MSLNSNIDFDFTKVKIKQEKPSPPRKKEPEELINDIIPTLFNNKGNDNTIDDKKSVEPVKSSNEILAELFKVFNAAPPKILLNDEFLLSKKQKKKHKKDKKRKKKSRKRGRSSSDESTDENKNDIHKDDKHKKKKRKKSKHSDHHSKKQKLVIKEEKDKEKSVSPTNVNEKKINSEDSDFTISDYDENNSPKSPISANVKIKLEKIDKSFHKSSKENDSFKEKDSLNEFIGKVKESNKRKDKNEKDKCKKKPRIKKEKDVESEISLSDEETYLKEKEKYNEFYGSSRNNEVIDKKSDSKRGRSLDREKNDFYRGSRLSSRDRERSRDRKNYRNSSRNRYNNSRWDRSRSRSPRRSTSRSRELGIDKKRLLEIARKNVISMFKKGALPGTQQMSQDIKDKVLMKMRYGGKTVEDLTDFCKKLSNGENLNELSDLSDGDSDHDKDGNEKAFVHHPFVLKDRAPIVMNIKNSVPIQPKSAEETKALLMQFPVSSGQQHRLNESEWVPVPPSKSEPAKPVPTGTIVPTAAKRMIQQPLSSQIPKTVFGKSLPADQKQKPAFVPLSQSNNMNSSENSTNMEETNNLLKELINTSIAPPAVIPQPVSHSLPPVPVPAPAPVSILPPAPAPIPVPLSIPTPFSVPPPMIPSIMPPSTPMVPVKDNIFPQHQQQNLDVASIISKRLNAMRRLQENPMDAEALKIMYTAQKDMSAWASTKQVPGQFTGSTGVNVLSARELSGGVQAWAKRDQFTSTAPVSGGMGMQLLQKMGWKPGEGLGRERNGALQPLLLEVKLDKRGVMATEEDPTKRRIAAQYQKKSRKPQNTISQAKETLETKHPVSLLGEIASKKRWTPPYYELVDDQGPSHNKAFIFKVVLNDIVYQPSVSSTTKKAAKAVAAKYCLQQMGVLSTNDNTT